MYTYSPHTEKKPAEILVTGEARRPQAGVESYPGAPSLVPGTSPKASQGSESVLVRRFLLACRGFFSCVFFFFFLVFKESRCFKSENDSWAFSLRIIMPFLSPLCESALVYSPHVIVRGDVTKTNRSIRLLGKQRRETRTMIL